MGIESDQIVLDYLSRVGDLAQSRQLPSSTRMRLVTELRTEIDRRRAAGGADSPAAVRRLIGRLGTPERIVAEAKGGDGTPDFSDRPDTPPEPKVRVGRIVPRSRSRVRADPAPDASPGAPDDGPAPPHLAGTEELGTAGDVGDWWRTGDGRPSVEVDDVPGFVGGVEIPDILKPPRTGPDLRKPPPPQTYDEDDEDDGEPIEVEYVEVDPAAKKRRGLLPRRAARASRVPLTQSVSQPLLLLAAVALVAGAVFGNVLALLLGWAVVYLSRQLTVGQKKWAVFGLPGLAALAGIVWLWGRTDGRWGEPIADGRMSGALDETWPWVLRAAAVASALYLLWRARSPRA
ncbi:HAAS signaling domain-containing protein [Streptomyces sp. WG-D5]